MEYSTDCDKDYGSIIPFDLEDAAVAVKDQKGKVRLHQAVNTTAAGAVSGGFWGSLIGLIFLNPPLPPRELPLACP